MCKCCQLPVAKNQLGTGKWNWLLATLATFLPLLALSTPPAMTEFPRFPVIVPSMENHAGDIAADLRRLTSETVVDAAALNASLQPRGDPPDDRAAGYVRFFRQLREAAGPDGPPLGVLLQSTMGHGGDPTVPAPFQAGLSNQACSMSKLTASPFCMSGSSRWRFLHTSQNTSPLSRRMTNFSSVSADRRAASRTATHSLG